MEERKINPETISKDQNKKEFIRFVEDFNTGGTMLLRPYLLFSDVVSLQQRFHMKNITTWKHMSVV